MGLMTCAEHQVKSVNLLRKAPHRAGNGLNWMPCLIILMHSWLHVTSTNPMAIQEPHPLHCCRAVSGTHFEHGQHINI